LANIIEIFTTEFSRYLYIVCKNSWKFNVRIVFYYVFNYSSKTLVSATRRTHARSQLSLMKQCDYSLIVVAFFLTKNLLKTRSSVLNTILLWSPYVIGQTIIFLPCSFFPSFFFLLLFFPRLISAAVDRMSAILLHMAWP